MYTGNATLTDYVIFLNSSIYYSFYIGAFAVLVQYGFNLSINRCPAILAFMVAVVWVLIEWFRYNVFEGIPWVQDSLVLCLAKSEYGLQWLSITGQRGISFWIVFVNAMIALFFQYKKSST